MATKKMSNKKKIISIFVFILLFAISFMIVCCAININDKTAPSGTISMVGGLIRKTFMPHSIQYESFGENEEYFPVSDDDFRISMSVMMCLDDFYDTDASIFSRYVFSDGEDTAKNIEELQKMFIKHGATEMYVRIGTKRYMELDERDTDEMHAKLHNLEISKKVCGLAAKLDIPINVEVGCFYTYADGFESQYPDFSDYSEITQPDKAWADMSLDEMKDVLYQYGRLLAGEIKETGCDVNIWDLGNETNYGFAGVQLPLKSAVSDATEKNYSITYMKKNFGADWLAENVWKYNAQLFKAVADGIKEVYPDAKFSSHVSTVTCGANYVVKYFKCLADNGYKVDQAGISFYPNSSGVIIDQIAQIKSIILAVNRELGMNVMLAEYGFANMTAGTQNNEFAGWNNPVHGYDLNDEGQARLFKELVTWGKKNGMAGIRPWAIEHEWLMSWFAFDEQNSMATAREIFNTLK